MGNARPETRTRLSGRRNTALGLAALVLFGAAARGQTATASLALPDAPEAQAAASSAANLQPCLIKRGSVGMAWGAASAAINGPGQLAAVGAATALAKPAANSGAQIDEALVPCTALEHVLNNLQMVKKLPIVNWYARFLDGPQVKPMTPREKAWLAVRNVADPFNTLTILASSAIAVGSNANSVYGPGFDGFGRYVGVSYTQDMTAEFIGTFLIPTIAHQDPPYHRMPNATVKRRVAHCLYQIAWTQGDNGKGMLNYADLAGFAIDDEIGNLYVPGRNTYASATAERYATALATAPIDNFITEFLPDIARRIHVRVVLIQRIINQVDNKDATTAAP